MHVCVYQLINDLSKRMTMATELAWSIMNEHGKWSGDFRRVSLWRWARSGTNRLWWLPPHAPGFSYLFLLSHILSSLALARSGDYPVNDWDPAFEYWDKRSDFFQLSCLLTLKWFLFSGLHRSTHTNKNPTWTYLACKTLLVTCWPPAPRHSWLVWACLCRSILPRRVSDS